MTLATERRDARERALGLLYEAETKGLSGAELLADLPLPPTPYAETLVRSVDEHQMRIDELISRFAQGWSIERMASLDRAALRMGTAELIAQPDVPTGVVLAETVELASRFSTDGSGRFVNGLLARIAIEVRPDAAATPPARQVDALVIDLDGVLRLWNLDGLPSAEKELGLPVGAISCIAFDPQRLQQAMDGRLTFEDWAADIGAEVAAEHGVSAEAVADAFANTPWRINLDVLDAVREVRASGVPVGLLSNASTRLLAELTDAGLVDELDVIVSSADIGVAKPDPAAYRHIADLLGLPVERCAFVDDTILNVDAAAELGMRAEHYRDADAFRRFLTELGLVVSVALPLPDPPLVDDVVHLRTWHVSDAGSLARAWHDPEIARWSKTPTDASEETASSLDRHRGRPA